jgi:nucleoside-diphosphate-sugar epimerase
MKNKKILLIGGNGYIGSRLYDYLLEKKYQVTNVDSCWYKNLYPETIVEDFDNLSEEFLSNYTHIILLAGHSTVSMCEESLTDPFENNVVKYIKLIEKLNHNQTLLYSSSAAIYGHNDELVDENYKLNQPVNFYDYTKLCNEQIAYLYPEKKLIGLRFGSVGGFSKNFRFENLLNSIAVNATFNKKINISNPNNMRSVLGLNDLCRSIEVLINQENFKNKIYNLTSINLKIIEFGEKIKKLTGCELIIENKITTNYSFNCSNKLFETDYNFKFNDSVNTIYNDIIDNYDKIVINVRRTKRK